MNNKFDNLIKNHGKRTKPNKDMQEKAKANVQAHWREAIKKHKQQKRKIFITRLAASVFIMLTIGIFIQSNRVNSTPMAKVEFAQGEIQISDDNNHWQALQSGQSIKANSWLKTSQTGLANLVLNDNSQLRINSSSLIHFQGKSQIELLRGEIYNDADVVNDAPKLLIKTKYADIQHIGTRYAVKLRKSSLQVMVRNGQVSLTSSQHQEKLNQQQQLVISDNGKRIKSTISTYDPAWQWTKLANSPYRLQGKSLNDFVTWYAHENGYTVDWNGLRTESKNVKLSGTINNIASENLFKTVLLSTLYSYEINSGILKILKAI